MPRKQLPEVELEHENKSIAIPHGLCLLLTSASFVRLLTDSNQSPTVFTSSTAGILAARQSPTDPAQLAIADAQVVIVHDSNSERRDRTYRLKGDSHSRGGEGVEERVRILRYANDGKSLFFTTSLQQSVQTYSVRGGKITAAGDGRHPQPPRYFAISKNGELMVSVSEGPTTILVQNLLLRGRAVTAVPQCSDAEVTHVAFHPDRPSIFLISFADGIVGMFDATKILREGARSTGTRRQNPASGELSFVRTTHVITTTGPAGKTITRAEFLPGQRAKVVTTGADGRCHILDFDNPDSRTKEGRIEKVWQQSAPCASLAILPIEDGTPMLDGASDERRSRKATSNPKSDSKRKSYIIAFARVDGSATLFNEFGESLGQFKISGNGEALIDLEWVKAATESAGQSQRKVSRSTTTATSATETKKRAASEPTGDEPLPSRRRKESCSILEPETLSKENIIASVEAGAMDFEIEEASQGLNSPQTNPLAAPGKEENYLALFSPIKDSTAGRSRRSNAPPQVDPEPSQPRKSPRKKTKMGPPQIQRRRSSKAFSVPTGIRRRSARLSSTAPTDEDGNLAKAEAGSSVSAPQLWADKPRKGKERVTANTRTDAVSINKAGPSRKGKERVAEGPSDSSLLATINRARNVDRKQGLRLIADYMPKKKTGVNDNVAALEDISSAPSVGSGRRENLDLEREIARTSTAQGSVPLSPVSDVRDQRKPARTAVKKNDPTETDGDIWLDIPPSSPPGKAETRSPGVLSPMASPTSPTAPVNTGENRNAASADVLAEIRLLRTEMMEQFRVQQSWFEEALGKEREMMEEIQAENKRLRRELFGR